MKHTYLIYGDRLGDDGWFTRLGLGLFWECGPLECAKRFRTRAAAVKVLHATGKHREGWRVIVERVPVTAPAPPDRHVEPWPGSGTTAPS